MRAFTCPDCRHLVVFESLDCLYSETQLGFDWRKREIVALRDGSPCENRDRIGCNGLAQPGGLCISCSLTRKRPADSDSGGIERFAAAEAAKRRLLFELLELKLPVESYRDHAGGLAFEMLNSEQEDVITGQDDGVITLDLAEADDAQREKLRTEMNEPYRTLLGHMRHEVSHYYEPILCPDGSAERDEYRRLFGDERADYQEAMDRHYAKGAPADWPRRFVSAYATMHPFEDWAETLAHYFHIRDSLQTAIAYGITVTGPAVFSTDDAPLYSYPSAAPEGIRGLLDAWLPMTYALNAMNRSMGEDDIYPFVLPSPVIEKLGFIHQLITAEAGS